MIKTIAILIGFVAAFLILRWLFEEIDGE